MNMYDIIQGKSDMWDLFTKSEEYNTIHLDKFGRFPYYFSKHREVMKPIISDKLINKGFEPVYPDGKKFALCLTHDIDVIKQKMIKYVSEAINSSKINYISTVKKILNAPKIFINKKKNPFWNFDYIMNLERKYEAESSFYFLTLDSNEKDYRYNIEELYDDINYISKEGWEVGLHGTFDSLQNLEELIMKKQKLEKIIGKPVNGIRNHFLKFRTPETWELFSEAGFKYDSTFGYADMIGFRNGMSHPFKPYDRKKKRTINILEIPLTIMDCTLFSYMKQNFQNAWDLTKELIDVVNRNNGVITILWHNTYMQGDYLKFYKKILSYGYEKNAWMTSGEKVYDLCKNNNL